MDFCDKFLEDLRILKMQWIVDEEWILAWIRDSVCLKDQILGLKQGLDHSSFVSLGQYVKFHPNFFLSVAHLSSAVRLFLFGVLCYSHWTCCLLYYLCDVNKCIHIYQLLFTYELLYFCFLLWLWCCIWLKILTDERIWGKRLRSAVLCTPFTPSCCNLLQLKNVVGLHLLARLQQQPGVLF